MDINTFRADLRAYMSSAGINTHRLSLLAKVEASSLYHFLKGSAALSGINILKLYPFIYKAPEKNYPCCPDDGPPAPTAPPGAGDAEPQPAPQESPDA